VAIRRLGPGDEGVVLALATQGEPARLEELLADERTYLLAAFDDSGTEPIGFVLAYELVRRHGDPARLFVYELGVDPARRRRGIATALMSELARLATERGIRFGFLLTNESNVAAMALYASLGAHRPNADDVLWDLDFS
jgi:aminoglycoside 3-N-acetyltransferase I